MIAVYDDRVAVPDEARSFIGIERFSGLVYRKRTLLEHAREALADAGIERVVAVGGESDVEALTETVLHAPERQRIIYLPSCVAFPDREAVRICLRKFACSDENFALGAEPGSSAPPVLAMGAASAERLLRIRDLGRWRTAVGESPAPFHWAENKARIMDLTVRGRLIEFLSSTFDARSFNTIRQDDLLVTKRSADVAKMRREYAFYGQLDGPLRMFFLQPLAFREGDGWAEYQTERLFIPDVAVQWIHRSFDPGSFANLLGRVGAFLAMRPVRDNPAADPRGAIERLYVGKVADRLAQLRAAPGLEAITALVRNCTGLAGPEEQFERFRALWRRLSPLRRTHRQAVSHGDLCFSNILYHRQSQQVKFIDPRGAENPEELWMDEYYDIAKLSHSVLGLYDFINHDLAELHLDRELRLGLSCEGQGLEPLQEAFRAHITALGFDLRLVRLYEASLFLSMLPLHADVPKKVVAFLITAARIMDGLES
jgi:hypothetical protein